MFFAAAGGATASHKLTKAFVDGAKTGGSATKRAAVGVATALATIAAGSTYKEMDMNNKAFEAAQRQRAEEARRVQEEQAQMQAQMQVQTEQSFTRKFISTISSAVGYSAEDSGSKKGGSKDNNKNAANLESIPRSQAIQDILDNHGKESQANRQGGRSGGR